MAAPRTIVLDFEETDGRRRRSLDSRARIVEAMLELARQTGSAPSAEQVAQRAGVGLRTVFRHFQDMESLYSEMVGPIEVELRAWAQRPFKGETWRERVMELIVRRNGEHIVFAVRDSGPGVEPAWREKIFDVFQRGDWRSGSTNSKAQRGAGVGLAVCRSIALAHGGELKLRARSHGGSSFECWLREEEAPHVEERDSAAEGARP